MHHSEKISESPETFSSEVEDDEQRALGSRLRTIRKSKGFSLKEVSKTAQVSDSFLSQVERGNTSPSISTLRRICHALGVNMGALFSNSEDDSPTDERLVRVIDRRRIFRPDGSANYLITPPSAEHLEVHHNIIAPGRNSGPEPYTHQGEEECVYVLSGSLELTWDGVEYFLNEGDAILIDPKKDHSFRNDSAEAAVVLWIISPAQKDI